MKSIDVRQELTIKVLWPIPMRIRQVVEQNCVESPLMAPDQCMAMDALLFVMRIGRQELMKMKLMEEYSMKNGQMKFADQEMLHIPREMQIVKEEFANAMTIIMRPNVKVGEMFDHLVLTMRCLTIRFDVENWNLFLDYCVLCPRPYKWDKQNFICGDTDYWLVNANCSENQFLNPITFECVACNQENVYE